MENRNMKYNDIELLSFMEASGMDTSYSSLLDVKKNIHLYEDAIAEFQKPKNVKPIQESSIEPVAEKPTKVLRPILKPIKEDKSYLSKEYLTERRANEFLINFLVEECGMSLNEYEQMTGETKIDAVKEIATQLLGVIQNKLSEIDSSPADRSRGDIKALRELPVLQDAITQLESLIERDENAIPEYSRAVGIVIKAILYINQYSHVFKDAYRNKKTLMILKYESLILSVISSVSYIISTIVDYKSDYLTLKRSVEGIMDFAPLKSLEAFIRSVDSGEFKIVSNDTTVMREFYLEVPVETMSSILEATDYLPMIVNGVKEIYQSVIGNGKLTNLIYKAVGVVILLFSLRDTFYTMSRMKTKVSEMLAGISNFAGINDGGNVLQKLSQFSNKFRNDAEVSSDISKREIEDENRKLLNQVKTIQVKNPVNNAPIEVNTPVEDNIFGFDF